uniref:Uncharacterized protein n=1 Tax=uncultured marine bacterium Ant4D5 TaxID=360428 RepID=Q2PXZ0_9BACT|nr:hypothetical protein [uncultured marine bacterium Ant4D5]
MSAGPGGSAGEEPPLHAFSRATRRTTGERKIQGEWVIGQIG